MAAKIIQFAGIAQLVERHIRNVEVLGSTPSTGTIFKALKSFKNT